jgi:hypothetical protein
LIHADGWTLWDRPHKANGDWRSIRVKHPIPRRGSYWLGWSVFEHRLARSTDYRRMPPHLREWVIAQLMEATL